MATRRMAATRPVVLCDLDGTLTDSRPGIVRSIRHALDELACPCPPDDALAGYIGTPLRTAFATLLGTRDTAAVETAMTLYRERYADTGLFENAVYDGIAAMLEDVRVASDAAFVATAKPTVYATRVLKHFRLDHHFTAVYGCELDGRFDDKTELLAHLLTTEGIARDGVVMVGDRRADIVAARANGIRSIGVLWGYGSERELREAGAHALCMTPRDLAACLAALPA